MLNQTNIFSGDVNVLTTDHRGMTPEEIADITIDKIIFVGKDSHPAIRDQAEAFKHYIHQELLGALKQAVKSDRLTLINRLRDAGHAEITKLLEN
jgi:hypothetical protein